MATRRVAPASANSSNAVYLESLENTSSLRQNGSILAVPCVALLMILGFILNAQEWLIILPLKVTSHVSRTSQIPISSEPSLALQLDSSQTKGTCSVYIYNPTAQAETNQNPPKQRTPPCDANDASIWPYGADGKGLDGQFATQHYESQYAAGYHIRQRLMARSSRSSKSARSGQIVNSPVALTHNIMDADLVYVDMSCFTTMWLSGHYSARQQTVSQIGKVAMRTTYQGLKSHPAWRASSGSNFIFSLPHPASIGIFDTCHEMQEPIALVAESGVRCAGTGKNQQQMLAEQTVIIPYVSVADVSINSSTMGRDRLLFYAGGCSDDPKRSWGQHLRFYVARQLNAMNASDIFAKCSCGPCPGHIPHEQLQSFMETTKFCVVIAGDTQSSRRLTEVMLGGCIPVFVGPLFHTLPLARLVNYTKFSLFFRLEDPGNPFKPSEREARTWVADDPLVEGVQIVVKSVVDMVDRLRGVTEEEVAARQKELHAVQSMNMYDAKQIPAGRGMSAVDAILTDLCRMTRETKNRKLNHTYVISTALRRRL